MDSCSMDGCERPRYCRGLCDMHYKRLRRHGDPTVAKSGGRPLTVHPGDRFGRLVVLREHSRDKRGRHIYLCRCDCGAEPTVAIGNLQRAATRSCGCLLRESVSARAYKHGHSRMRGGLTSHTYKSWIGMRQRCRNPNHHKWKYYGAMGVTICERWDDFASFLADMGERPEGTTLDRIDPDGNYEPSNCRWADNFVQSGNRRNAR